MFRKKAKHAIAVASATLAAMALTPGVAQAAIMPDARCLNGYFCFSNNNSSGVGVMPPTSAGACVKLPSPGNNFWNRRTGVVIVYNDSVGGCLAGAVTIRPNEVYNLSMNYTAVRQWSHAG